MSNKDIFKRENRLAETLKTEHLQDWASHRILDYLMCRHENEPLGKPSQVELALWAELTKADQRIENWRQSSIALADSSDGWKDRAEVAEAKLAELERAAALTPPSGVSLIAAERDRQISVEGWTPEHDDEHDEGELAQAAMKYANESQPIDWENRMRWPYDKEWWKPSPDPIRNLVKAGALIAAEIDRLQRLRAASAPCTEKEKL